MDLERKKEIEKRLEEINDRISLIKNNELFDEYDEMLDEQGVIRIGSLEYSASHVLKNVDEIAYDCGYDDYFDGELSDLEQEKQDLENELKGVV